MGCRDAVEMGQALESVATLDQCVLRLEKEHCQGVIIKACSDPLHFKKQKLRFDEVLEAGVEGFAFEKFLFNRIFSSFQLPNGTLVPASKVEILPTIP